MVTNPSFASSSRYSAGSRSVLDRERIMELVRVLPGRPASRQGRVVALGNFDGVHLGHQELLAVAVKVGASASGEPCGVLTFEPHPGAVLRPDSAPGRLTMLRAKARKFARAGVGTLYIQRFSKTFACLTAETFIEEVLVRAIGALHVVVGHDFRFGAGRAGNACTLTRAASSSGFGLTVVDPVLNAEGSAFGSTAIRGAVAAGDVDEAARALGAPYEVEGRVRRGETRGRRLGFATANLHYGAQLAPLDGIYAGWARVDGEEDAGWQPTAISTGTRPHFNGTARILEAHIIGFGGNLYGRRLRVAFTGRIRAERKFANANALIAAMARDVSQVRAATADAGPPPDSSP